MINNKQKVCPEALRTKLDPIVRRDNGTGLGARTTGLTPLFVAMVEFVIQVPLPNRYVQPAIESICTTGDRGLIVNGDFLASLDEFQANLRRWAEYRDADSLYELDSLQGMLDANLGIPTACPRVTV